MLTSSANHYLRPEYLSPIQGNNIELDAKKSPLALLAQTCSQIGADLPQKNSSMPSSDRVPSKGKSSPGDKSPSSMSLTSEDVKSTSSASFKPYEKKNDDDEDDRGSPLTRKKSPYRSGQRSPTGSDQLRPTSRSSDRGGSTPLNIHDPPVTTANSEVASTSSSGGSGKGSSPLTKNSFAPTHTLASLGDLSKDPLAAYKLTPSLYPLGLGLESLGAAGLSALTAKVPTSSSVAGMSSLTSPYIGYARVKTATGSEVIIPICRDPYCTGCQINTHALQVVNGTCPPGCSQCAQVAAHTKSLSSLPSSLISSLPASSLSSLYAHPSLLGGSHSPYVCNWISGDTYCGKRFSSSEELLQHLRSHTNLSTTEASSTLALPSLHHHPLLSAHHTLPRGYPTPPLSPLSAAARYHPYAKATLSHLPPTTPLSSALSLSALTPHPLSPYYNPYSLYARATVGLHP